MRKLTCKTQNTSNTQILIENGLKDHIFELDQFFSAYRNMVIITDRNVAKHHLVSLKKQLKSFGGTVYGIVIEPGEQSKNLSTLENIYYELSEYGITRADAIIALGGGVVGDIAGFAAATYMRGIDFYQVPTSLIAQVDSSVGGKTGVDLSVGKNLVGAFYPAKAVLVDPEYLKTLDDHFLMDGMGEVIKYGCISSSKLFVRLMGYEYQEDLLDDMEDIVTKCLQIKRNVVEEDERESGVRRILNFGHTIGHVIETYFDYGTYTHGEAVAIGMYNITRMSVREGITPEENLKNLAVLLDTYGLPKDLPEMDENRVKHILNNDKKFEGDILNVCVIPKIGVAEIVRVHKDKALQLFT